MPAVRTLSQLPELKDLTNETLVSMAQPQKMDINDEEEKIFYYQSRKVKISSLMKYTIEAVHDDLDTNNGLYGINITTLRQNVNSLSTGGTDKVPVDETGRKHFDKLPYIDESLSAFDYEIYGQSSGRNPIIFDTGKKAVNVNTLSNYVFMNASPNMTSAFGFVTHLSSNSENDQVSRYLQLIDDRKSSANKPYQFGLTPDSKRLIQNEFIFKINPGETESNVWTAPASGMFTCYGWLDEHQNDIINNSNRWVALMAQNEFGNAAGKWFILQLQPFIKNKYLSYVGFSFPVSLGLKLKIRIGFEAGSNSDKYYNVNGGIANHVPNAFFGGVYTGTLQNKAIKVNFDDGGISELPEHNDFDDYYASEDDLRELSDALCAENEEHRRKDNAMSGFIDTMSADIKTLKTAIASAPDYADKFTKIDQKFSNLEKELAKKSPYVNQLQRTGGNQKQTILRIVSDMNNATYKLPRVDYSFQNGDKYYIATPSFSLNMRTAQDMLNRIDPETKTDKNKLNSELDGLSNALAYSGEPLHPQDRVKLNGSWYLKYGGSSNGTSHQSLIGKWYLDDNFFYYQVTKNSTVRILLYPDCMANQAVVDCYLLHSQTDGGITRRKFTTLGRAIELFNGIDDQPTTITMPLSAGTELAFAIWYLPTIEAAGVQVSGKTSASKYSDASKKASVTSPHNKSLDWTKLFSLRICPDSLTVKEPTKITLTVKGVIKEAHDKGGTVHIRVVNSNGTVIGSSKELGSAIYGKDVSGTCKWTASDFSGKALTPVITVQCKISGVGASSTSDPHHVTCEAYVSNFSGTYKSFTTNNAKTGIDTWSGRPWGLPLLTYGDLSSIVNYDKNEMAASGQKRYALLHPTHRNDYGANIDGVRTVAIVHEFWD